MAAPKQTFATVFRLMRTIVKTTVHYASTLKT